MPLNSAKRCRHCVYGACARQLSHKIWYLSHVVKCFLLPSETRCLNAALSIDLFCMRASKALASPYICACSPWLELLTNVRHQMQLIVPF